MRLELLPSRGLPGELETTIEVSDDVIIIDGISYDLSSVPEGGEGEPSEDVKHIFVGPITRVNGVINTKIRVSLGDDAALNQPPDPSMWIFDHAEGPVVLPIIYKYMPGDG